MGTIFDLSVLMRKNVVAMSPVRYEKPLKSPWTTPYSSARTLPTGNERERAALRKGLKLHKSDSSKTGEGLKLHKSDS